MARAGRERRGLRHAASLAAAALVAAGLVGAVAAGAEDTSGLSTLDQRIVPASAAAGYRELTKQVAPDVHIVRDGGFGTPGANRASDRTTMAYFAQLSDFQLADEESPARVEFFDPGGSPFESAHRPWEALNPQIDDAMIRQVNEFADAAPVSEGDGDFPVMDYSINTGDSADSQQLNETQWVNTLIEGGPLDPGTGKDPAGTTNSFCNGAGTTPSAAEAPFYTGVQDYDDYDEGQVSPAGGPANDPYFYDPDTPASALLHSDWPQYTGLMDRAQAPFTAEGLDVPHYATFGNHDALVQGSLGGNQLVEQIATGCIKPLVGQFPNGNNILFGTVTEQDILDLRANTPEKTILVPPDPDRRFVSKEQYMDIFREGGENNGHGFGFIDPAQSAASAGNAGYYSFSPKPGVRMIALDTVSEGGALDSASGNLDDPQFRWLEAELQEARDAREAVILYSHHAPDSMSAKTPDEAAVPCTGDDAHGHDETISCDVDPRVSTPLHIASGAETVDAKRDLVPMLHRYPNVIGWVAGHSHVNRVQAESGGDGQGFWIIRVAAEADWPQQARLLQLFDNEDGTLSIFGTIIDHESDAAAPAAGSAAAFTPSQLASVGRTLAYNDPQKGARKCSPACGEGSLQDRNVELLVNDPRLLPAEPPAPVLTAISPGATADTTSPRVIGNAEANSTVTVYESGNCSGAADAAGSAAAFGSTGIAASVADGAAAAFSVTATDAFGNVSDCSNSLAFQEIASPAVQQPQPTPPAAKSCPKGKKLKKGTTRPSRKCVKKRKPNKKGKKRK